ncbi:MAG: Glycine betaine methyltransferase [Anaerolineales bacterium]|nr:Glycine betaine methyltransferase [Anaerolineales bacterium]
MKDAFISVARPRLSLLDEQGCERIHQASLEILRRTGVRVHEEEALALLKEAGALVTDDNLVKLPPGLVEWALGKAPSRIVLCKRGGDEIGAELAGRHVNFGTGSDCPNYLDPKEGHRKFTAADVAACVRLCDALPEISFVMSMGIPSDVPAEQQYRHQFALMLSNTTKPAVFVADDRADCEAIVAMAAAAADGGVEELRLNPTLLLYSEPTTPLVHSQTATEKLLYMAEQRLPIVHSPAPMMGGTAPITLAGGMALGNAEVLSSLVMHQLKREGAPFVYGTGLHHLDMQTTISVYGAPEFQLARAMVAEMGRHYRLPSWGYSSCSDSPVMDAQATADAAYQVRDALLMGANLVHDVGYMEGGLTTSPEMIVFTAEMIEMHRHFVRGVSLDDESLALDVIHEAGPGGDFMGADHTFKHFREYWFPTLFERRRSGDWESAGSRRLGDRLREKTIAIMDEHEPEPLPDDVREEIDYILHLL